MNAAPSRKFWIITFALWIPVQVIAITVGTNYGRHLAEQQSYERGMCKINGVWNSAPSCKEKGVKGSVWKNYDGTYRVA